MTNTEIIEKYKEHISGWGKIKPESIKPYCFVIKGDELTQSTTPFSIDAAEDLFVAFHYNYMANERWVDSSFCPLFINKSGRIETYYEYDGWKLRYDEPVTQNTQSNGVQFCRFYKDDMKFSYKFNVMYIKEEIIPKIWKIFREVRKCTTQDELDQLEV